MLWTFLQNFSFIPLMASEEMILNIFLQIYPFDCHGNQSNSEVWTKFICLVEDYSRNISVKLLSKYLQYEIAIKAYFHVSNYKSMEILGCQSNESTWATAIKNISAKFQLHPPYGFWGDDFLILFHKFSLSVAMATIKFSSLDKIHMIHRGLLKEHFCKTFVKIPTVRKQ